MHTEVTIQLATGTHFSRGGGHPYSQSATLNVNMTLGFQNPHLD